MQMMHNLIKYALICMHSQDKKIWHWIKPGSNFLFHFVSKVFLEGIFKSLFVTEKNSVNSTQKKSPCF